MKDKKLLKLIIVIISGLLSFWLIANLIGPSIASIIYSSLLYGKYNTLFISELVLLIITFIILIIRKKLYIFKEKKEKFIPSIKKGMPILVIAIIVLISNFLMLGDKNIDIANLGSLIFLAITVGLAEELLFRGWLQNEITEKFSNNRKEIILSIIASGCIFGLFHSVNVLSGQDIFTTLMQIIQTSAIGILLGSIYFVTKNISSVIFLHSFYDFAVLLGEVNNYKDCITSSNISNTMMISSFLIALIYALIYLIGAYFLLQRSSLNKVTGDEINEEIINKDKENRSKAKKIIVISVILMFLVSSFVSADDIEDYEICFDYETIKFDSGSATYFKDNEFFIGNYKFNLEDNKLNIEDIINNTEYKSNINNIYDLIVYEDITSYVVLLNGLEEIYYLKIDDINTINFSEIDKEFIKYDVPEIMEIGYFENNNIRYPLLKSSINDYFIIKDEKIMVLK